MLFLFGMILEISEVSSIDIENPFCYGYLWSFFGILNISKYDISLLYAVKMIIIS